MTAQYTFSASVWVYPGEMANWHFVTVPKKIGVTIKATTAAKGGRRGFGAVRVRVEIGSTTWTTSMFPDRSSGSYLLPLKAAVRKVEDIEAGDVVQVTFNLAHARE